MADNEVTSNWLVDARNTSKGMEEEQRGLRLSFGNEANDGKYPLS